MSTLPIQPSLPSKRDIQESLFSYAELTNRFSRLYKGLGETYHKLPETIRKHDKMPIEQQHYCELAFTRSDCRELPDMIQLLYMLNQQNSIVSAALFNDDLEKAYIVLGRADWLLLDAADRMDTLTVIMEQYGKIAKKVEAEVLLSDELLELYVKWWDALPESLQGMST